MNFSNLPGFDNNSAFDGALRLRDINDDSWRHAWGQSYGNLCPEGIRFFSYDAFGVWHGLKEDDTVVLFWSETGEIEELGVDQNAFFDMIQDSPDDTISLSLYQDATQKLGRIDNNQNYAFIIETALGGAITLDNIRIMDVNEHMRGLGQIAQQINNFAPGTKITPVNELPTNK